MNLRIRDIFLPAAIAFLLVACGGGGGGGGGGGAPTLSSSKSSLQFDGYTGESIASQDIGVSLSGGSGAVYVGLGTSDPSVVTASFNATGATTATITVTPAQFKPAGSYSANVVFSLYADPSNTQLIAQYTYPVTLIVHVGLAVNPSSLSMTAPQGAAAQANIVVTPPEGSTGTLSASVAATQPSAPWLTLTPIGSTAIQVTASAVSLTPGAYPTEIDVSFTRTGAASPATIRVPLSFTVGPGLIAPSNQVILLRGDTASSAMTSSVDVTRGDGAAASWSATSDSAWLVLSPTSGTTPGTLSYFVDQSLVAGMPEFADSTATITLSSTGVTPTSFTVTLQKRLPHVAVVAPYGIDANSPAKVVVGGNGFTQLTDPASSLQTSGLTATNIQVLSDTELSFDTTPASSGSYVIGIANSSGISTRTAALAVSAPYTYAAATVPHAGSKFINIHDPVRKAVFSLSRTANAIYRYTLTGTAWSVAAMAITTPLDMGLAPDGSHLWITTGNQQLLEVDPDSLTVLNTFAAPLVVQGSGGALVFSSDGKLWLPGSNNYFDLLSRTIKILPVGSERIEFGTFNGPADGSLVMISPSHAYNPIPPDWIYDPATRLLSNPMGALDFWYEPRFSRNGGLILRGSNIGELYDRRFALVGQLPTAAANEWFAVTALTPDGNRILVLRKVYTSASQSTLSSIVLDVYSTSTFVAGTTTFARTASIPIAEDAADCGPYSVNTCYSYLLPSVDSKTAFWIGGVNMQVIPLP